MVDNTNIALHDGYQTYFNFVTGFSRPKSSITTTQTVDKSFEGKVYVINFADGSKILLGYKLGAGQHFTVTNDASGKPVVIDTDTVIHAWVLNPSQGVSLVGDPQPYTVDLGAQTGWQGSLYAPNFLSQWLSTNNTIEPPASEAIHGSQVIHGYGGRDNLSGALGNDTIFLDAAGLSYLSGGRPGVNSPTGNDTFVILANTIIPGDSQRTTTISGTEYNFFAAPQAGEINTIESRGNNDFSLANIHWINRIVFNGATKLLFGGGNFLSTDHIAPNAAVVGDGGTNSFEVFANPADISPGHSSSHGAGDVDLSQLLFQNWGANDSVVIKLDQVNSFGETVKAPNVSTTIIGGHGPGTMIGGSANDTIIGGSNTDVMSGMGGNDIYTVGAADTVDESVAGSSGIDTVRSSTISINLGDAVHYKGALENIQLLGSTALGAAGNGFANIIDGSSNTAVNLLRGIGGNDIYDISSGDIVDESFAGSNGTDTVRSSLVSINISDTTQFKGVLENVALLGSANLNAIGNANANVIAGNAGANIINGWLGKDIMAGGGGNDSFYFSAASHSGIGANADVIGDFDDFGDDRIDLSVAFGGVLTYKGAAAITGVGQVNVSASGTDVFVHVNVGGTLASDMDIRLANTTLASMTQSDFVL